MLNKLILVLFSSITFAKTGELSAPEKFFNMLEPLISEANQSIYVDRKKLTAWSQQYPLEPTEQILDIQKRYLLTDCNIKEKKCIEALKKRVDVVPNSLALSQAALESGFGTSRFAKEGNAFYGQWCFKKGCGIQPKKPNKSLGFYAVKSFKSPKAATIEYIHNLNTQSSYESFRNMRAAQRKHGLKLNSLKLVETLNLYSTSGKKYLQDIKSIIKTYQLQKYDNAKYSERTQNHFFV